MSSGRSASASTWSDRGRRRATVTAAASASSRSSGEGSSTSSNPSSGAASGSGRGRRAPRGPRGARAARFFCLRGPAVVGGVAVGLVAVDAGRTTLRDAVEHDAEDAHVDGLGQLQHPLQVLLAALGHEGDDDEAVDPLGHDHRVGDRQGRRGVDDDHVVAGQLGDQVAHPLGPDDLAGVVRDAAGGQDEQADGVGLDQRLVERHGPGQHLGEADAGLDVEERRHHRATQVAVDEHDLAAAQGQCPGQQRRHRGLALGGLRARDHHGVRRGVGVGEHQVGAQVPQRLTDGPAQEVLGVQPGVQVARARDRADQADVGHAGDVVGTADLGVEPQPQHDDGVGEDEPGRPGR